MIRLTSCAAVAALGALLGAACLLVAFSLQPGLHVEMDRDLPRSMASGLYPSERAGELTFAWTAARADITLPGADRTVPWACVVRYRGGRGEPLPQPTVDVAVDGITLDRRSATNEFQDVEVTVPVHPSRATLTLSIASSTTVVPGPGDPRELGVQLERLACRPSAEGRAWPPRHALGAAMGTAAIFGGAIVLAGTSMAGALASVAVLAALQALPLSTGPAPYSGLSATALRLALWIAALMLVAVKLFEARPSRQVAAARADDRRSATQDAGRWIPAPGTRLPSAARFVVCFSACALYLKLLGLLHPSKLVIDAVFHAHRFQAVLGGGYYFTQGMPGGVSFPYAVALYVFAAPWSFLTRDYVSLLRIVVSASEVVAGAMIYLMVVRAWGDRTTAALAVVLFNLVPLPYGLIGNANLTNAFGQSAALVTVAAAAIWTLRPPRGPVQIAGLFVLASLAFLAHISTAALLGVTLTALAALYRVRGDPALHLTAWRLLAVTSAAAIFSIAIYYGHFTEVYKTLARVRAAPAAAVSPQPGAVTPQSPSDTAPAATPLAGRVMHALYISAVVTGWPLVLLALPGAWQVWRRGRDRLALVLAAWGIAYCAFFAVGMLPRVDAQFERYAAEFVGRVVFATYPAAVVLAAVGAMWSWRAGVLSRVLAAALLAWTAAVGFQQWSRWFE